MGLYKLKCQQWPSRQPRLPSYLDGPDPTPVTDHWSHPLLGSAWQPHRGFPRGGGSGSRRPRKEYSDTQIRATNKDASPPWCIVLLINEQWIGPPLPGSLHQALLGTPPLLRLSCRNFDFCLLTSETHRFWPSVPWYRVSNRYSSCCGCHSPGIHGRNQGIWSIGRLSHAHGCGTQPTRSWPKRVKSLQDPWSAGLPSAMHRADTTSSFSNVSSRSLISRVLVETRFEVSALSSTTRSSSVRKAETSPPFLRTRRTPSFLVLQIDRTLIASPDLAGVERFNLSLATIPCTFCTGSFAKSHLFPS